MRADLSIFSRGAWLLRQLQELKPGQAMRITANMLADVTVPANPLDRQTPEYLIEFFRIRLPFFVVVRAEPLREFWDYYRPMPEEIERLMEKAPERSGRRI